MLCGNCGHDNPRENRYCGMCGTPFPRRLTIPDEQSALAFSSAPITVPPAPLPISALESLQTPAMSSMTTVQPEEPPPLEGEPPAEPSSVPVTEDLREAVAVSPESAPPPLDGPIESPPVSRVSEAGVSEAEVEPETLAEIMSGEVSAEEPAHVVEVLISSPPPRSCGFIARTFPT